MGQLEQSFVWWGVGFLFGCFSTGVIFFIAMDKVIDRVINWQSMVEKNAKQDDDADEDEVVDEDEAVDEDDWLNDPDWWKHGRRHG